MRLLRRLLAFILALVVLAAAAYCYARYIEPGRLSIETLNIAGAGLDVYEHEGPIVPLDLQGQPLADELFKQLLASDRVIYSPHVAYYTDEAVANLIDGGLDATLDVILHGDTANRVNDLA